MSICADSAEGVYRQAVWGYDFGPDTNVADSCVERLRSNLPDDVVRTVRNVGYKIQFA